jgi:hypothetical protein
MKIFALEFNIEHPEARKAKGQRISYFDFLKRKKEIFAD